LGQLPDRNRAPLLLCYLEGKTQDEAAAELGWPRGTLKRRLERGRDLLRSRLARRGITLSAGLFVAALAGPHPWPASLAGARVEAAAASAAAPATVAGAVSAHAAALAEGGAPAAVAVKVKLAAVAVLAVAVAGAGLAVHCTLAVGAGEG